MANPRKAPHIPPGETSAPEGPDTGSPMGQPHQPSETAVEEHTGQDNAEGLEPQEHTHQGTARPEGQNMRQANAATGGQDGCEDMRQDGCEGGRPQPRSRVVPERPPAPSPAAMRQSVGRVVARARSRVAVADALSQAFEELGGVPALVEFGRRNPREFYALWVRTAPRETRTQHTGAIEHTLSEVRRVIVSAPDGHQDE